MSTTREASIARTQTVLGDTDSLRDSSRVERILSSSTLPGHWLFSKQFFRDLGENCGFSPRSVFYSRSRRVEQFIAP